MMLRNKILIVDDEIDACIHLHQAIKSISNYFIIIETYAFSAEDAERLIQLHKPAIVFMDINLKGESGLSFIERIGSFGFHLIFVTAHFEFAIRAIKLNAIDYILKPIQENELSRLFERLNALSETSEQQVIKQRYLPNIANKNSIILKNINTVYVVEFRNIMSIEGSGAYSIFHIIKDSLINKIIGSHSLIYYAEILPENIFYRSHKSAIVNINHVEKVNSKKVFSLLLKNGYEVKLSRRKYSDIILKLNSL
jgi:two-component system, LytTR family, response regulator